MKKELLVALESTRIAVEYLRNNCNAKKIELKEDGSYVTENDKVSEQIIISNIKEFFPDDLILSEEKGIIPGKNCKREWIIDSLDGTLNFILGIPFCGVSLSLVDEKEPLVSVTRSIFSNEYIYRFANHSLITNTNQCYLHSNRCVIIDNISADVNRNSIKRIANICYDSYFPIRSLGSAAIGIMNVILQKADAYFAPRLRTWDIAPALHYSKNNDFRLIDLDLNPWQPSGNGFGIVRRGSKLEAIIMGVKDESLY